MAQASSAAWSEFRAMSHREASDALAYLAGFDPRTFEKVLDVTRRHREECRAADLAFTVAAACERERVAEVAS